jgi:hypothetical protein
MKAFGAIPRHKLHGKWITWSFAKKWWIRIDHAIIRTEYQHKKVETEPIINRPKRPYQGG